METEFETLFKGTGSFAAKCELEGPEGPEVPASQGVLGTGALEEKNVTSVRFSTSADQSASKTKVKAKRPAKKARRAAQTPYPQGPQGPQGLKVKPLYDDFVVPSVTLAETNAQSLDSRRDIGQRSRKSRLLKHHIFAQCMDLKKSEKETKEQLQAVDHWSEDDIDFELEKISLLQDRQFTNKVATLVRDGTGWIADKMLKAEGQVKAEFQQDKALKEAISKQVLSSVGLLPLSLQIAVLAGGNIFFGINNKRKTSFPKENENGEVSNEVARSLSQFDRGSNQREQAKEH